MGWVGCKVPPPSRSEQLAGRECGAAIAARWQSTLKVVRRGLLAHLRFVTTSGRPSHTRMALSGGAIAGIVIGSIALAAVVIVMGEAAVHGGACVRAAHVRLSCKVASAGQRRAPLLHLLVAPVHTMAPAHISQRTPHNHPPSPPHPCSLLAALGGDEAAGAGGAAGGGHAAQQVAAGAQRQRRPLLFKPHALLQEVRLCCQFICCLLYLPVLPFISGAALPTASLRDFAMSAQQNNNGSWIVHLRLKPP